MRRTKDSLDADSLDPELLKHIRELGLRTPDAYRSWCATHGFSQKLNKHPNFRLKERSYAHRAIAEKSLAQKKRETRHGLDVFLEICSGKISDRDLTQSNLQRLARLLKPEKYLTSESPVNRRALIRLISHLFSQRTRFFEDTPVVAAWRNRDGNSYAEALGLISAHYRAWLRPVEDWKPRTHNARRQFASLLRHLFVRYDDMPSFFDTVWFSGRTEEAIEHRRWFLHVGQGHNIRHCNLPMQMTKRMSHYFMQAPDDLPVTHALRWAQVRSLGGDERLARTILGSRLGENFEHNEFWTTVIGWFIAHPMLDRVQIAPIIDYLHHQRFVPQIFGIGPGGREQLVPPQPHLTMKGRSPESLLRQTRLWHQRLGSHNTIQIQQWPSTGISGLELLEGSQQNGTLRCWTIRELLSSKSLLAEGRKLKHCVATYASSCAAGRCSIWTMELETFSGHEKLLTIEVRKPRQICQIRGKMNRFATPVERRIIQQWASSAGLMIASYVFG